MAHKDLFEVVVPYINDSDELRPAAKVFEENGYYTAYPPGTKAFMDFWDEELRRCIYGYTTPSGLFITGYNYFYLNYSRIIITKEVEIKTRSGKTKKVPRRVESFPRVYDYDVAYFLAIEAAEEAGKHLATIKARGKGYSYKGASMLCRNFYCIPKSRSLVVASETEFLTKDGLLSKAWDMMSFIDQHTAFSKKRQKKDTTMHKRASFIVEDEEFGIKSEVGWGSEIMGITLKNDPDKARGKRAKLILWEESGKFPNLKAAWQIARPSVEDNNIAFGLMIAFGTGGSGETSYEGLKDLFYEPYAYNVLPVNNIWDDGAKGNACSFFVPNYYNMEGYDKEGIVEKGKRFMDENGNSDVEFSIKYMLAKREEIIANASDKTSIDRYIAERPMKPAEATLILSGNIFPKKDLLDHLSFIITHENIKNLKQLGDLYIDTKGKVKWRIDSSYRDITRYRIPPGESKQGAIAIWEHPIDDPPWGLYIIGVDPYDFDSSTTDSLGSCFVYKRFQNFESYYDLPVAEYTGRPETASEFYEKVRLLALYYNATVLYENEKKGLFDYFLRKNSTHLLADQPSIIKDIIKESKVERAKGIHMTKEIKNYMIGIINEWLREEYSPGKKNLTKIFSTALLEELIAYNDTGNFDRVISFGLVLLYKRELYNVSVKKKEKKEKVELFSGGIFRGLQPNSKLNSALTFKL